MTEKIKYVNGFMFSRDMKTVALIRKNKPSWQKGRLNGIGGKVEPGETFDEAMIREFWEEAGIRTEQPWQYLLTMENPDHRFVIRFFICVSDDVNKVRTCTDEAVEVHDVSDLNYCECIDHLSWIIPFCLSRCCQLISNRGMGEYDADDFGDVDVISIIEGAQDRFNYKGEGYWALEDIKEVILKRVEAK